MHDQTTEVTEKISDLKDKTSDQPLISVHWFGVTSVLSLFLQGLESTEENSVFSEVSSF